MSTNLPLLEELESTSRALGIGASELHGALCGWLAGGGTDDARWLARVLADDDVADVEAGTPLARLHAATVSQFERRDFAFQLLLPDDDASLYARSGALFEWCRGFVGGVGLVDGAVDRLSDEGREALDDLARLATATPEAGGDDEDEAALAEIEEFVHVAVLLVHGDCVLGRRHRERLN